jgi:putative sigma-54 modulation protein
MDINFQYDAVKASDRLEILAAKKLQKLFDKYDFVIRADVLFKKENTASPETGMICNIRLSLPGPLLFAESSHGTFEVSISETVDDLERQLRKKKEKKKHRA